MPVANASVGTMGAVEPLRQHAGGHRAQPGWTICDSRRGRDVDFVGNRTGLSRFADGSAGCIHAPHTIVRSGHRIVVE